MIEKIDWNWIKWEILLHLPVVAVKNHYSIDEKWNELNVFEENKNECGTIYHGYIEFCIIIIWMKLIQFGIQSFLLKTLKFTVKFGSRDSTLIAYFVPEKNWSRVSWKSFKKNVFKVLREECLQSLSWMSWMLSKKTFLKSMAEQNLGRNYIVFYGLGREIYTYFELKSIS